MGNLYAERVNGLIKNDYLKYWKPKNYEELKLQTSRAVNNYNKKNHSALKTSPVDFEYNLLTNQQELTKEKKKQKKEKSTTIIKFENLSKKRQPYSGIDNRQTWNLKLETRNFHFILSFLQLPFPI